MAARLISTWLRPVQRLFGPGFVLSIGLLAFSSVARAGLFSDDEARQAILELRQRADKLEEGQKGKFAELNERVDQLRRSVLELNGQIEQLRADLAKQRGQDELLARDVAELQRKQKDLMQGVDERVSKLEPQSITLDGKTFQVDAEEKRAYDEAISRLKQVDFDGAIAGLTAVLKRFPGTGYRESALFWLGNAHYGKREYKDAITSFRTLIGNAPDHARSPEAMLSIANCQIELKETKGARKTLEELIKTYPKSEAAAAARERLAATKS
jgi:tol-pal system protein YbgF